jgi:hypothetical protein
MINAQSKVRLHEERENPDGDDVPMPPDDPGRQPPVEEPPQKEPPEYACPRRIGV